VFSFHAAGRSATGEQVFYRLASGLGDYPSCLTGSATDPVRQDKREVAIDVVHGSFGGKQPLNVATSLTCRS